MSHTMFSRLSLLLIPIFCIQFINCDCDNVILKINKEGLKHHCRKYYNGELSDCNSKRFPAGSVIEYQCDTYFSPQGDKKLSFGLNYIQCISSYWSGIGAYNQFSCTIDCGIPIDAKPLIIDGTETNPNLWPWHASIFAKEKSDSPFKYICGGSLIKPLEREYVIITAAHCLSENRGRNRARDSKMYKVILGGNSSDLEESLNNPFAVEYNIQRIKFHDSYQDQTYQSDIALVLLDKPIVLSPSILPVCLGHPLTLIKKPLVGSVIGFGRYEKNVSTVSPYLREAMLPVVESENCNMWRSGRLQQSEICAGAEDGVGTCKGDSGGGFVFKEHQNNGNRFVLQGIVSHSRSEAGSSLLQCDSYSVFTRVASYVPWIYRAAEDLVRGDTFDCCWLRSQGVLTTGKHEIKIGNVDVEVLCDMTLQGGGWTVIQHRTLQGPRVDFERNWAEYEAGFGEAPYSYWLGLKHMSKLTENHDQIVRFDLEYFNSSVSKTYAEYNTFHVAGPNDKYKLELGSFYGTTSDGNYHSDEHWSSSGKYFSTFDQDNDGWEAGNCAKERHGAWWYWGCNKANPNGIHFPTESDSWNSVFWLTTWPITSLKTMRIAVRNKNTTICGI